MKSMVKSFALTVLVLAGGMMGRAIADEEVEVRQVSVSTTEAPGTVRFVGNVVGNEVEVRHVSVSTISSSWNSSTTQVVIRCVSVRGDPEVLQGNPSAMREAARVSEETTSREEVRRAINASLLSRATVPTAMTGNPSTTRGEKAHNEPDAEKICDYLLEKACNGEQEAATILFDLFALGDKKEVAERLIQLWGKVNQQNQQKLAQKKQKAKQLVAEKKWQEVIDLCRDEHDAELVAYVKVAKDNRAHTELVESLVASSLKNIREAYSNGMEYKCPFPRKNRGGDWLVRWTEPRCEMSDEDKLAGESRLEEFGSKYLPNAYANYEKVRDAAKELQQIFNEEFPEPRTIKNTSSKWNAFNKVLEKFAKVRAEYFVCHDELCHYWMSWRLGVLNSEDLAKIDSQKLTVHLLPPNFKLAGFGFPNLNSMEGKVSDFAAKYAPETYAIYQKLLHDLNTQVALLKELFMQRRIMDYIRYDRALTAAVMMRNDIIRKLNAMLFSLKEWHMDHRTTVKTSEDVAKCDHEMALQVKPFVDSLPSYLKDRVLGPVISKAEMIPIPGKNYRMQRMEVTQIQWMVVMGNNPSSFEGADRPVENVSWNDCKEFIEKLNAMQEVKASGLTFRLPTEAEWEYACRAGSTGDWGKRMNGEEGPLDVMGWFVDNSERRTYPVGMKEPNAFGLYDMHGNVQEWCVYNVHDPDKDDRVRRGGSWDDGAQDCRSAYRADYGPSSYDGRNNFGFRLCCSAGL